MWNKEGSPNGAGQSENGKTIRPQKCHLYISNKTAAQGSSVGGLSSSAALCLCVCVYAPVCDIHIDIKVTILKWTI